MKTAVHILATVRKAELLPAAVLVFSTLRVGFPNADVMVWGNALAGPANGPESVVRNAAKSVGAGFNNLPETAHDIWIEALVGRTYEPLWIVDTDVVFFGPLPGVGKLKGTMLAGRYEPEFMEEWSGTRHLARLHTAVMYIDPSAVRSAAREWMARFPLPWRNSAEFAWIRQVLAGRVLAGRVLPGRGNRKSEMLFYDTMAGVYHSGMGVCRAFTEAEDGAFEHLHCGGYVDLMAKDGEFGKALQAFHQRVYENPLAARGARLQQAKYYAERAPKDPFTVPEEYRSQRKRKGKR